MTMSRQQLYSGYERFWHWFQATTIVLLLATGVAIHFPRGLGWLPFAAAVRMHNALAVLLLVNAALGLFYYVTSGQIRQYLPRPGEFLPQAIRQAQFYLQGIFHGQPHPHERTAARRLNPLQQVTYLVILNVLVPLQIVSGILIWGIQRWPQAAEAAGGLPMLAMVHTLGAWLFLAFAIMHVYLITTGRTPLANLKAMAVGYEEVREEADPVVSRREAICEEAS